MRNKTLQFELKSFWTQIKINLFAVMVTDIEILLRIQFRFRISLAEFAIASIIMKCFVTWCIEYTASTTSTCMMLCELRQRSTAPGNHFSGICMAPITPPPSDTASCNVCGTVKPVMWHVILCGTVKHVTHYIVWQGQTYDTLYLLHGQTCDASYCVARSNMWHNLQFGVVRYDTVKHGTRSNFAGRSNIISHIE